MPMNLRIEGGFVCESGMWRWQNALLHLIFQMVRWYAGTQLCDREISYLYVKSSQLTE